MSLPRLGSGAGWDAGEMQVPEIRPRASREHTTKADACMHACMPSGEARSSFCLGAAGGIRDAEPQLRVKIPSPSLGPANHALVRAGAQLRSFASEPLDDLLGAGVARPAGPAAPGSGYVWARMCRGQDGHPGLWLGGAVPFVLSDLQDSEATAHAFPLFFFYFPSPLH